MKNINIGNDDKIFYLSTFFKLIVKVTFLWTSKENQCQGLDS